MSVHHMNMLELLFIIKEGYVYTSYKYVRITFYH